MAKKLNTPSANYLIPREHRIRAIQELYDAVRNGGGGGGGSIEDLTPAQKAALNSGITADKLNELETGVSEAVQTSSQSLTESQKSTVRNNIGALGTNDVPPVPSGGWAAANDLSALDAYVHSLNTTPVVVGPKPETGTEGTVYRVPGDTTYTDWMYYNGTWNALATYDAATLESQFGYYKWTGAGNAIALTTSNQDAGSPIGSYDIKTGGSFKIKMTNAATGAATLSMNGKTATPLLYNGEAVSASNTWESGEVISVYYDGTNYQATNAKVGSGKAADMKYDNSQSGLAAENVQEAIDEVAGAISTNMADADLDIGDKNGNILVRFADGDIQTKRFNSSLTPKQGEGEVGDLEITDENNHVLVRFYNGHLKTKYFDSKESMKGVYNVLSMGAVGDGETDDTIAIQNTLEHGGLIVFPSGLYLISSPLIFKSNTTILMSEGAEIKQIGTSASCVLRSYSELTDTEYNGVHDVHIIGGCINANGSTTYPRSCIAMIHVKDIIFEGVTFKGQSKGMHSVDFAAGKNVKFKDCIFTDIVTVNSWGECIQIDGATSTTSYPYLSDIGATDSSQIFDDVGCEFIEICGCTFYLNEYSPAIGNHNYSTHNNIIIHDNTVIGLGANITTLDRGAISFNIWSGYPNQHNQSDMVFIHHNIINGCYYGFSFDDGSDKHIYIRDNMLFECGNMLKSNSPCAILLNNIENN